MHPLPGVQITVITETSYTPYSGMLPGHVAGYYTWDECHIDVRSLAQSVGARLYVDRVVGLDLDNRQVLCAQRPPVAYDVLSLNIGSTPVAATMPGADKYTIPAKPIRTFLHHWQQLVEAVSHTPHRPWRLAIVGGGAGGVELALNMRSRLHRILSDAGQPPSHLAIHLFQRGAQLVPDLNSIAQHLLLRKLVDRGIHVHLQREVLEVQSDRVFATAGMEVECDRVFWVTQASPPSWLAASGLATDERGFIQLNPALQSTSHPQVFAAGDIASVASYPRPKAGVFAVRQGKPLARNLSRFLSGRTPQPFRPQKHFLRIVGTGDRSAVAAKWHLAWESPLMWRWKEWIEFRFMGQFRDLKPMPIKSVSESKPAHFLMGDGTQGSPMRCGGCGSKVGSSVLTRALQRVRLDRPEGSQRQDIVLGLDAPDDAAAVTVPTGQVLVQTLDFFKAIVDDPFLFGQIAAHHCLSDLFAMGAVPQSALAIATVPYAAEGQMEETLYHLLSGAIQVLDGVGAALIGGHTTEGPELTFGLTCNGLAFPDRLLRKRGMQPGLVLVSTKALGTGILFAAHMRLQAQGSWIDTALASMLQSNQAAAQCLQQHGASACTDVSGFGLLGHLAEMVLASAVTVHLDVNAIPILPGAAEALRSGIVSSLQPQNLRAEQYIRNRSEASAHSLYPLLFDPQTSGGLLATLPADRAKACLTDLHQLGYTHSSIVGRVVERSSEPHPIEIRF
jgi:selenide,water dikinase